MLVRVKILHSFKYRTRLSVVYAKWHWSIWYQIVSVSWLSSKKNATLCIAMTEPKYWILCQLLPYTINKSSPRELVPLNLSLFFSRSIQNPASNWFFKQEADRIIWPVGWEDNLILLSVSKMNIKANTTSRYNMYRYWNAVSVGFAQFIIQ